MSLPASLRNCLIEFPVGLINDKRQESSNTVGFCGLAQVAGVSQEEPIQTRNMLGDRCMSGESPV